MNPTPFDWETLTKQGAGERFDQEVAKLVENMADPNVPWKGKREITIKLALVTNEERQEAKYELKFETKKVGPKSLGGTMFFGMQGETAVANLATPPNQTMIDDPPAGVVRMNGGETK